MQGNMLPGGGGAAITDADSSQPAATPIMLLCRAVNLSNVDPSANSEIAYAVENQLKNSPLFDPKTTQLVGNITPDDSNGTFTFGVTISLINPLKL